MGNPARRLLSGNDLCGDILVALKAVQIVSGPLGVGGSGKDSALVILQDFQPGGDIGGMVFAILEVQAEIGTKEGRAQFGNKFFLCITFVAIALTAKGAVEAGCVPGPVCLMPTSA